MGHIAALWMERIALPVLSMLHRATALLTFPLLEPLALTLSVLGLFRRRFRRVVLAAIVMFLLLWYPAYWTAPPVEPDAPDAVQLEQLCDDLIRALDASPLRFTSPFDQAEQAAGMIGARIKVARHPEWMRALGISGLFSPWTGEVIVDPDISPALLPFTCVHELEHLRGIADEGAANIAAYRACLQQGGMFADSARLYALRLALPMLRSIDPEAAHNVASRMDAVLIKCVGGGTREAAPSPIARLLGIGGQTASYAALIHAMCMENVPAE